MKNKVILIVLVLVICIFGGLLWFFIEGQHKQDVDLPKALIKINDKEIEKVENNNMDISVSEDCVVGDDEWENYSFVTEIFSVSVPIDRKEAFVGNYKGKGDFDYTFSCSGAVFFVKVVNEKLDKEKYPTTCFENGNPQKSSACFAEMKEWGATTIGKLVYEITNPQPLAQGGGCHEYVVDGVEKFAVLSFCGDEFGSFENKTMEKIIKSFEFEK
ncbi:MAG: hypothetical protein WCT18_00840 [Patescibacteria group bacterium]